MGKGLKGDPRATWLLQHHVAYSAELPEQVRQEVIGKKAAYKGLGPESSSIFELGPAAD